MLWAYFTFGLAREGWGFYRHLKHMQTLVHSSYRQCGQGALRVCTITNRPSLLELRTPEQMG